MNTTTQKGSLAISGLILIVLVSCSTTPKGNQEVFDRRNEAAGYIRLGDSSLHQGQLNSAAQFYNEALQINLAVDNTEGAIMARSSLGKVYLRMGAFDDAKLELGDALFDAQYSGNSNLLALTLNNLGEWHYNQNQNDQALTFFTQALENIQRDTPLQAIIHHNLGVLALDRNDLDNARMLLLQALEANEKARIWAEYASNAYMTAVVEHRSGDRDAAISWAEKALEADKRAENPRGIGADLEALGNLHKQQGNVSIAFDYYRRAFHVGVQINDEPLVRNALDNLVELSQLLNEPAFTKRYQELLGRL